jgi:hypothetical protein
MHTYVTHHQRFFAYEGHDDWGFGFDCEKDGTIHPMNPAAADNLRQCLTGRVGDRNVVDCGIRSWQQRITTCNCGSGLSPQLVSDAKGIPVASVCRRCRKEKLRGYRPEIFTDSRYEE